eukprot:3086721-Pyramimonas_sp.AAC.1
MRPPRLPKRTPKRASPERRKRRGIESFSPKECPQDPGRAPKSLTEEPQRPTRVESNAVTLHGASSGKGVAKVKMTTPGGWLGHPPQG